jgi:hypothetical protein
MTQPIVNGQHQHLSSQPQSQQAYHSSSLPVRYIRQIERPQTMNSYGVEGIGKQRKPTYWQEEIGQKQQQQQLFKSTAAAADFGQSGGSREQLPEWIGSSWEEVHPHRRGGESMNEEENGDQRQQPEDQQMGGRSWPPLPHRPLSASAATASSIPQPPMTIGDPRGKNRATTTTSATSIPISPIHQLHPNRSNNQRLLYTQQPNSSFHGLNKQQQEEEDAPSDYNCRWWSSEDEAGRQRRRQRAGESVEVRIWKGE